ncbi:GNAT family N-acetyltransferase [Streptomyces sp. 7N604]|uniref:GNAT family N-acetyltransferase n=1 Tax=Streptomyces sp. 7N604 TaxID=3457415 RepID=UPI003FD4142E
MAEVFLRRLTRWQAETQREAMADVYVEAYKGVLGEEFRDRQDFLLRFADHVQHPGFEMVIASTPELAGCAYGFRADRSGTWWQGFLGAFPSAIEELTASGQVFVLAEVMVLPAYRRRHIATRLKDHLLARCDAALAVALIDPGNGPARNTCQAWAWTKLGQLQSISGASPLDVWGRHAPR